MFGKDWREFDKRFDGKFEEAKKTVVAIWVVAAVLGIAVLTGAAFVTYQLMLHFGIM